jgi:hypothetical protein
MNVTQLGEPTSASGYAETVVVDTTDAPLSGETTTTFGVVALLRAQNTGSVPLSEPLSTISAPPLAVCLATLPDHAE